MAETRTYTPPEAQQSKRPDQRAGSSAMSGIYTLAEKSAYITIPLGIVTGGVGLAIGSAALAGMAAGGIMLDLEGNRYFKQSREAQQRKAGKSPEQGKRRGPVEIFSIMRHKKNKQKEYASAA